VERGEIWWAQLGDQRPVVLLSGGAGPEFQVMQIVAPATPAEKHGFLVMSGEQALDEDDRRRIMETVRPDTRAVGIEVFFGVPEGLAEEGVVRVALPQDGKIFCTWGTSLTQESLIERIGALSSAKLQELEVAMELAGAKQPLVGR
jgi:mRNA interferase MazF